MDRRHLFKPAVPGTSDEQVNGARQAEIREIDKPLIEIRDGVVNLILDLQVIEKRAGGEAPFENIEVQVKVDGERVGGLMADESGLIEKKGVSFAKGKSFVTVTIPGTTTLYRKKIAEITSRDFDEEKRLEEEMRGRAEEEKARRETEAKEAEKRAEELRLRDAEAKRAKAEQAPYDRYQQKVVSLYSRWFECAVHRFLLVDRKEALIIAISDLESRIASGNAKVATWMAKVEEYRRLESEDKELFKKANELYELQKRFEDGSGKFQQIHREQIEIGTRRAQIRERSTAILREIIDLKQNVYFEIPYDRRKIIDHLTDFIFVAQRFINLHVQITNQIRGEIQNISSRSFDEMHAIKKLNHAVEIWKETYKMGGAFSTMRSNNRSLLQFLPELRPGDMKDYGVWDSDRVRRVLSDNRQLFYKSSDGIYRWDDFKRDISSYLGQPLEETEFYRNNQADFELVERCKESRKIE